MPPHFFRRDETMKTTFLKVTLGNDTHKTTVNINLRPGGVLSVSQTKKVERNLCCVAEPCLCRLLDYIVVEGEEISLTRPGSFTWAWDLDIEGKLILRIEAGYNMPALLLTDRERMLLSFIEGEEK